MKKIKVKKADVLEEPTFKKSDFKERTFKKEYIPLIICAIVLVVLVSSLIYVIFHKEQIKLEVPELPKYEHVSVGVADFKDGNGKDNSLQSNKITETKVNYRIVSDYYKKGILLSNVNVEYMNDEFIIRSGAYSNTPFVSSVSLDGKLNWIYKISIKEAKSVTVVNTLYHKNLYYVFLNVLVDNQYRVAVFTVDSKGKKSDITYINKKSDNKANTVIETDSGFATILEGNNNLEIYYVDYKLKVDKKVYKLSERKENIFKSSIPIVRAVNYKNNVISIVVTYMGGYDNSKYIVNVEKDFTTKIKVFNELEKIESDEASVFISGKDCYYAMLGKKVYMFDLNGRLSNTYDYSNLQLENPEDYLGKEYIDGFDEDTELTYLELQRIVKQDDGLVVNFETSFNNVYDIYDSNLKLKKRFMLEQAKYRYTNGVLLSTFYIDGKLYDIYSYGFETPSIMINTIG